MSSQPSGGVLSGRSTKEQDEFIGLLGSSLKSEGGSKKKESLAKAKLVASAFSEYINTLGHDQAFAGKIREQYTIANQLHKAGRHEQALQVFEVLLGRFAPQKLLDTQKADYERVLPIVTQDLLTYKGEPNRDDTAHNTQSLEQVRAVNEASQKKYLEAKGILDAITQALVVQRQKDTELRRRLDACVPRIKDYTRRIPALAGADPKGAKELTTKLMLAQEKKNAKNADEAERLLDEVEREIVGRESGQIVAPEGVPLSKQQEKDKEKLDTQRKAQAELELKLARVSEVLSPDIKAIFQEHQSKVDVETKAFAGIRFLDDLFALKSTTEEQKAAKLKKLEDIGKALDGVKDRRKRLGVAINGNPGFKPPDKRPGEVERRTKEIQDAVEDCWGFWDQMGRHVPDEFALYLQGRDFKELATTFKDNMNKTPDERRRDIDGLINGIPQQEKTEETTAYTDAIGEGSLKPAEVTAFYFDEPVRSITPEQQKKLIEVTEKIINRAYKIRQMGGTVADVEKSLAHIPEEFWPPQFVEDLQAWRKVEREMAEERVAALFADPKKMTGLEKFGAFTGIAGFVGDLMSITGGVSDVVKGVEISSTYDHLKSQGLSDSQIKEHTDYKKVVGPLDGDKLRELGNEQLGKDIRFLIEETKEVTKMLGPITKAIDSGDPSSIPESDWVMVAGKLATITSKIKSINAVSTVSDAGKFFASNLCPFLAAIGSGLDLAAVCMQMDKLRQERKIAVSELDRVEFDFFTGQSTDKAMVNAIVNEKKARDRQVRKKGVEVAAKTITFAGDGVGIGTIFDPTGATAITSATLKVTGKTIELGNKVVFSFIDWGLAKKAMKLLDEAQAGNPVARVEIFKDCGLYAKMYICCAARDGDPMAKQLIIDRGITEGDLTKPMALKLLREKLMKGSEQKDERRNTKLGGVLVENVMGSDARKIANQGPGELKKPLKVRKKGGAAYTPGAWKAPAAVLTLAAWNSAKAGAIANGLYDEKTGIGAALGELPALFQAAMTEFNKDGITEPAKKKRKEKIVKAMDQAMLVIDTIGKCEPVTNLGQSYPEMIDYLSNMRSEAFKTYNDLDRLLYDATKVGAKVNNWQPPRAGDMSPAGWKANWEDAVAKCMLAADDKGVHKALVAIEAGDEEVQAAGVNKAKKRAANFKLRKHVKALADALNAVEKPSAEFPTVVAYLRGLLTHCIALGQQVNTELLLAVWADSPKSKSGAVKFSADGFTAVWVSARTEGYATGNDPGMANALRKCNEAELAIAQARSSEAKASTRVQAIKSVVDITKLADKLEADLPETHKDMKEYIGWLRTEAHAKARIQRDELGKVVNFETKPNLVESDCRETFNNAATAGVIERDDKPRDLMAKAIKAFVKARKNHVDERDPKKKRVLAKATLATLNKIEDGIVLVGNGPGFEHPKLVKYLTDLNGAVTTAINEKAFQDILGGEVDDSKLVLPPDFGWTHKSWKEVKDRAVKLGIAADTKTGFGKALDASKESYEAWSMAAGEEKKAKLRDKAVAELEATVKLSDAARKLTRNAKLTAYLDKFKAEAERRKKVMSPDL